MQRFTVLSLICILSFSCSTIYKSNHQKHTDNTPPETVKSASREISSLQSTIAFCNLFFIGHSANQECVNLIKNNQFFLPNLVFCYKMSGNSQKLECLRAVANKVFPQTGLNRCNRPPFSASCLEAEGHDLIPQREKDTFTVFNCTTQTIRFSMQDEETAPLRHVSLPSGKQMSKSCAAGNCENKSGKIIISSDGKHRNYSVSFGNIYSITFDKTENAFMLLNEPSNVICSVLDLRFN